MPSKNSLGKIKDMAVNTAKHPLGTSQKVAGQVVVTAASVVGAVAEAIPGRGSRPVPQRAPLKSQGDPLAPEKGAAAKKAPAKKLAAAGRPEIPTPDETALAKQTTSKTATKKTATKKTATKKTAAKESATKKSATAKKPPAKGSPAGKKRAADESPG